MKPRLGIVTLVVLGMVFAADYTQAQTSKKQLVGTWSVVSDVNVVDGKQIDVFGPSPQGQFIFTADGNFAININRPARPKFASNNRTAGTPEENKAAVEGYIGEFGTYTINSDGSLTLHIIASSYPNWDTTDQQRHAEIKGNEMKWTNPTASSGSGFSVLMLKRVKKG